METLAPQVLLLLLLANLALTDYVEGKLTNHLEGECCCREGNNIIWRHKMNLPLGSMTKEPSLLCPRMTNKCAPFSILHSVSDPCTNSPSDAPMHQYRVLG